MNEEQILKGIQDTLVRSIQRELLIKRPSRAYDGTLKPVSGKASITYSNRIYTGKLYRSTTVDFETNQETGELQLVLSFPNAPEWIFVDQGRRGKQQNASLRYPPLRTILEWTRGRGLPQFRDAQGRFMSNRDRAFLVQRSIGEYGIYPTKFVSEAFKKAEGIIQKEMGLYAAEFFRNLINKKIIIRGSNQ
jgi:hypothetical protein